MKFKVGQKVRMVEDECDARVGDVGVIVAVPRGNEEYAVEFPCFDGTDRGHYCHGTVPSGNGHWIRGNEEYAVEFPCFEGTDRGHYCHGTVPSGNGHWIREDEMELASEQDFPEITQVTIKDSSGTTTVRARVTKYDNGYTIEKLAEPKFSVGEQFVTASGKLGKVTKVNPEGNYCVQWFNGKYCSGQPENTMRKIVWDK